MKRIVEVRTYYCLVCIDELVISTEQQSWAMNGYRSVQAVLEIT